jgi:hypothetical protein
MHEGSYLRRMATSIRLDAYCGASCMSSTPKLLIYRLQLTDVLSVNYHSSCSDRKYDGHGTEPLAPLGF